MSDAERKLLERIKKAKESVAPGSSTHDPRARREGLAGILLGGAALVTSFGTLLRPSEDADELTRSMRESDRDLERDIKALAERVQKLEQGRNRIYRYERQLRNYLAGVFRSMGVGVHAEPEAPDIEPIEMLPPPLSTSLKKGASIVQPKPAIPTPPDPEQD